MQVAWERARITEGECWKVEINQLLFADDSALVADEEEMLCRQESEFGRVFKRRKLKVNVCRSVRVKL